VLPESELEGIDFRPFFDMVVGILFIFIILIGALLLFQQAQRVEDSAKESERRLDDWQGQKTQFLVALADHLRARGIDARIDLSNTAVVLPLDSVAQLGPDGLPDIKGGSTRDLGRILALDVGCVASPREDPKSCGPFDLLRLNEAVADIRIGPLSPSASLPQDRFGRLLSDLFAASLLKGSPGLLMLSGTHGDVVLRVTSALAAGKRASPGEIGGDLVIRFAFARP